MFILKGAKIAELPYEKNLMSVTIELEFKETCPDNGYSPVKVFRQIFIQ
jgi:hypothetical protein